MAHEEGSFHSFSAVLGNDLAIQTYREGKVPFPDGAIIAALHYSHVPSEENNKVFGDNGTLRTRHPDEHSVYGQGYKKVRRDGRLGFRSLPGRQTWR